MNRRLVLFAAAGLTATAACTEKRGILTDPVGATAFGFQMQQLATNLPRGSVRFVFKRPGANAARPDSFDVNLSGLDSLTNGYYTAWAGDSLGTTFKRISGTLTAVRTDTTLNSVGNPVGTPVNLTLGTASAIQNGNPSTAYRWRFERIAGGLTAADSMQTFLISIEDSPSATTPNERRRPIWARRGEGSPSQTSGIATSTIRFGNYAGVTAEQYLYSATPARGRGVVWGDILTVTDSTLARPPLGFYYAVFAIKGVLPGQTTGDTLFVGEFTSPSPRRHMSLFHSDSIITDPLVVTDSPRAIIVGSARISADTVSQLLANVPCPLVLVEGETRSCPYYGYTEVRLTLELKEGVRGRMSPWRISGANVPFVVTSGQR